MRKRPASKVQRMSPDMPKLPATPSAFIQLLNVSTVSGVVKIAILANISTAAIVGTATAKRSGRDTRSHLVSARGRSMAADSCMMSQLELATARDLFPGRSDSELQRLYKRVTK